MQPAIGSVAAIIVDTNPAIAGAFCNMTVLRYPPEPRAAEVISMRIKPLRFLGSLTVLCSLAGAGSAFAQDSDAAREGYAAVQELQVVDCLLPGQVRVVGGRTYLTPRRPTRTTAADCAARGGEYLAYDRADYRSALNVWREAAESGDAEAQTMVGEIYERGLGGEPSYELAAEWYRRAAEQGFSRAQFNLGTLYEQGLGVAADRLEALNWYRLASGLSEDSVIFQSAAAAEQQELRRQLEDQVAQRDRQIQALGRQVEALQRELDERARGSEDVSGELESLRALLGQLESARDADRQRLAAIPEPQVSVAERTDGAAGTFAEPEEVNYRRRDFGRYYALIIGVQEYQLLDDLTSPANDVARVKQILEETYGFSVLTLVDPNQLAVMRAINALNETLREQDNLLIYFAGHGNRLRSGAIETGYWLPTNAEPAPDDTLWVPNEFVSRHLGRVKARRVLVVSDSCYAGLLGDDPGYVMVGGGKYSDEYIEWKMPKRSRLVLASGFDSPVTGETGEMHSVFSEALIEELEGNDQILTAPELFLRVRERIKRSASASELEREPALKVIKDAGHEVGDFFFVPARS
jgi:uncharacterized protein